MITVRKATTDDVDFVDGLLQNVVREFTEKHINMWQKGYPNRSNIVSDIASDSAYVAEVDGVRAGYMFVFYGTEEFQSTLRGTWRDDNCSVMHRLLTDPAFRHRGLGTTMMGFWENLAREHGCTSLRTETDETNTPMRALMRHCGFIEPGYIIFDGSEKIAFEKVL
ncbi:MAG: GNAT family N-acetyltransferase [archaeon]|nr:GNAT family N-acetyltransferase [archaeon]